MRRVSDLVSTAGGSTDSTHTAARHASQGLATRPSGVEGQNGGYRGGAQLAGRLGGWSADAHGSRQAARGGRALFAGEVTPPHKAVTRKTGHKVPQSSGKVTSPFLINSFVKPEVSADPQAAGSLPGRSC